MGNTVPYNCYERWGKRTPDGALISFDPQKPNNGSLSYLIENFDYDTESKEVGCDTNMRGGGIGMYINGMNGGTTPNPYNLRYTNNKNNISGIHNSNYNNSNNHYSGINTTPGSTTATYTTNNNIYGKSDNMNKNVHLGMGMGGNYNINSLNNGQEGINKNANLRVSRRRPTYSPNTRRIVESEDDDDDDEDKLSTDNSEQKLSASDIKAQKIKQYRKTLTKVVKIKTAIFHETVKVTCSKDGEMLEWYKGKSDANGKKKPIGFIPLNKIISVRTKSDNPKYLEIAVNSVNISTYLFIFKTRDEREEWQSNLESFKKIMSMK